MIQILFLKKVKDTFKRNVIEVLEILKVFDRVGYVIHPIKFVLIPTQTVKFPRFMSDSVKMTATATEERKQIIILYKKRRSIRKLDKFIGTVISTFPGSKYGLLSVRVFSDNVTAIAIIITRVPVIAI